MALMFQTILPIFAPPTENSAPCSRNLSSFEVHFSRWNNANAEPFESRRRAQAEIEHDLRLHRRYTAVDNIANHSSSESSPRSPVDSFRSAGTPSAPSKPSIPGRKSKYSKPSHPAFRKIRVNSTNTILAPATPMPADKEKLAVSEDGVSYRLEGVPFELMYSYTETPKAKPLALREAPYSPFGPVTMDRPWTGRAPLPPSKKKLKEFDSFVLPPPHKKGVKPVQSPGPFLPGSGPKYVRTREEILGEPLTKEEIDNMVESCLKTNRQLNIGRDGLTHNMLDNIHAHWKRRRVCKIKCKGVCTVDLDNVKQQLEEKTGGKVIYERGGVLFIFRGRNYNYRTRPRFPLMLWKPITPVYPRLVKKVPDGLTSEQAVLMRKKGRTLIPICKLGKNGVYKDLVKHVREAFELCEMVRIDCQGMNGSDYRKIGGKLKDLVPCVLISFELEHILMWRGADWKSSFLNSEDIPNQLERPETSDNLLASPLSEVDQVSTFISSDSSFSDKQDGICTSIPMGLKDCTENGEQHITYDTDDQHHATDDASANITQTDATESGFQDNFSFSDSECERDESGTFSDNDKATSKVDSQANVNKDIDMKVSKIEESGDMPQNGTPEPAKLNASMVTMKLLWQQALQQGSALLLENAPLDADIVYGRSVAFSQSAPQGPVFMLHPRRSPYIKAEKQEAIERLQKQEANDSGTEVEEEIKPLTRPLPLSLPFRRASKGRIFRNQINKEVFKEESSKKVPRGTLGVDELAKLLA